jgi:hypothetical protein
MADRRSAPSRRCEGERTAEGCPNASDANDLGTRLPRHDSVSPPLALYQRVTSVTNRRKLARPVNFSAALIRCGKINGCPVKALVSALRVAVPMAPCRQANTVTPEPPSATPPGIYRTPTTSRGAR